TVRIRSTGLGGVGVEQPGHVRDGDDAGSDVHLWDQRLHERNQQLTTVRCAYGEGVLSREVDDLGDGTDVGAVGRAYGQADELMVVVLGGVVRHLGRVDVDDQDTTPQGLCACTVVNTVEAHQQPPRVLAGGAHDERALAPLDPQRRTRDVPTLRLVGAYVHADLATDTVCAADATDHDGRGLLHRARTRQRRRSTSTKSMRVLPLPTIALTTVRMAVAVRPERPMTLPRSLGLTRTSSVVPRR